MSMSEGQRAPLRRVGAIWKPKPGTKSKGSGSVTIDGLRQRFVVLPNDRKTKDTHPDYVLMSADEPEADDYQRPASRPALAAPNELVEDEIPF